MRRLGWLVAVVVVAGSVMARAETGGPMSCGDDDGPLTMHDYERATGDVLQWNRLEVRRPFSEDGRMEVQVCDADLRVRTDPAAKEMHLTVELGSGLGGRSVADFIHTLRVGEDHGVIRLRFPKGTHATVTLTLPMGAGSKDEFSVGRGDMDFNAINSAGQREINVGMGHLLLHVDEDKSYSKMEVNVGMGWLHDHRRGGQSGHFVVAREYAGKGPGSMEVNVGMGTVNIQND